MRLDFVVQKDSVNTLKEEFLNRSNKKLKKLYVVSGTMKETGFEIVEECLIDSPARKLIFLGIDKKYTTRKTLEGLIRYTKNVYIHNNNGNVEVYSNIYVFEYEEVAYVYLMSGNVSDSFLTDDINMYNLVTYDLLDKSDKKEYEEYILKLSKEIKDSGYIKLTKEVIEELVQNKEVFTTKQYIHSIPSISDLLGKEKDKKDESDDNSEVKVKAEIPKIKVESLSDDGFEIDLGNIDFEKEYLVIEEPKEEVKKEQVTKKKAKSKVEEVNDSIDEEEQYVDDGSVIDMESLLFDKAKVRLNKKDIITEVEKTEEVKQSGNKKIDLDKVSNVIMELPKQATKGKEQICIKVQNYIRDMIPAFFEGMENGESVEKEDGKYKEFSIVLEIIDVNQNKKYLDKEAKLSQKVGQTYISFVSDKFKEISYEEDDIARVIKLSNNSYHIEIIPKETEEYNLWKKLCTQSYRGSERFFGMM